MTAKAILQRETASIKTACWGCKFQRPQGVAKLRYHDARESVAGDGLEAAAQIKTNHRARSCALQHRGTRALLQRGESHRQSRGRLPCRAARRHNFRVR